MNEETTTTQAPADAGIIDEQPANPPIRLSIVVPVFNEAESLPVLHQELSEVLRSHKLSYELIFVDDGSTDASYPVLSKLHEMDPHVKVIQFRRNFGQTAAFAAGFELACGELIATMDADGQNDPEDIPGLIEELDKGDFDLVSGWRKNRKESLSRRLVSKMANLIISKSTRITVHDRGCSLKLFRRELAKEMRLYGQMHRFMPEMAAAVGAHVAELPVNDRARKFGKSKYGALTRTPRVLLDLITVFYLLSFFSSPMRFFGAFGISSGILGALIGGMLAGTKIYYGLVGGWEAFHAYEIGNRPLLLLAVLLVMLAVQFLMMGLLGEMIMRTYYETQNKPPYAIRKILG